MTLIGNLIIRCSYCGAEYTIDIASLDEDVSYIGEGSMGEQFQHTFTGEIACTRCGQQMVFCLMGYEYPAGVKEYQDSESENCEIIEEPYMEIEYIPEPVLSVYEQIYMNPQVVYSLDPDEFEEFVAKVFRRHGYQAEVTQKTRDGGVDITAFFERGGIYYRTFFECKRYRPDRPVGAPIVRALYGAMERDRVDKGVLVTTSRFTRDAIKEAEMLNGRVKLIDYQELQRLMRQ